MPKWNWPRRDGAMYGCVRISPYELKRAPTTLRFAELRALSGDRRSKFRIDSSDGARETDTMRVQTGGRPARQQWTNVRPIA